MARLGKKDNEQIIKELLIEHKILEQENATLKKQLEALSGDIPWKDIKDKSEVIGQLIKAKEIISEFVKWANWQGSKCPSFKSILDKAEQFIKE